MQQLHVKFAKEYNPIGVDAPILVLKWRCTTESREWYVVQIKKGALTRYAGIGARTGLLHLNSKGQIREAAFK